MVTVEDNHNGTLSTPYTIQVQEKEGSEKKDYTKSSDETVKIPEFSNIYEATGEATLSGTKKLTGGTKKLEAGDFSFKLRSETAERSRRFRQAGGSRSAAEK